jgi:hypothetical protein
MTETKAARLERLYKEVYQHCIDHYTENGHDYVVEAFEKSEIIKAMGDAYTLRGAMTNIYRNTGIKTLHERDEEHRAMRDW